MKEIWIIGIGRFGQMAVEGLAKTHTSHHLVLVDPDKENLSQAQGPNRTLVEEDGVLFVHKQLKDCKIPDQLPDWIIPALPVHLAAQWCIAGRTDQGLTQIGIPATIDRLVPHPTRDDLENLYVTHADFRCPDKCDEPEEICTITRKKRHTNMFTLLGQMEIPSFQSHVIRSDQLGPGIGGYRPIQLFSLLELIDREKNDCIVSTACRCHGVMTALGYR